MLRTFATAAILALGITLNVTAARADDASTNVTYGDLDLSQPAPRSLPGPSFMLRAFGIDPLDRFHRQAGRAFGTQIDPLDRFDRQAGRASPIEIHRRESPLTGDSRVLLPS